MTGYRELNDLAERTPLFVAHAASDYAQALSGHPPAAPPTSAGQNGGDEQVSACTEVCGDFGNAMTKRLGGFDTLPGFNSL